LTVDAHRLAEVESDMLRSALEIATRRPKPDKGRA